jgi:ribosome-associated protein
LKIATLSTASTPRAEVAIHLAFLCARVAADNKARDVVVLDMRGITPLYDYFVLATGGSRRQIHTMAEEIDAGMAAAGEARRGIEGYESARWVVQDYGDIVVHLFDAETRQYYGLDDLWADAKPLDWQDIAHDE